jgi:hypothetical protein
MANERVKSKNLFNFRLTGVMDEDIVAFDSKMKADFGYDPEANEEKVKTQSEAEFATTMRAMMDGYLLNTAFFTSPTITEVIYYTLEPHCPSCYVRGYGGGERGAGGSIDAGNGSFDVRAAPPALNSQIQPCSSVVGFGSLVREQWQEARPGVSARSRRRLQNATGPPENPLTSRTITIPKLPPGLQLL